MSPSFLTPAEADCLKTFFDGVDSALSSRMRDGSTPSEDNLTFLLCELLDDNLNQRHVLSYSLKDLNNDLESCGTGTRLDIIFETHRHSQRYEGEVSQADLGIVFERISRFCSIRKAVLLQCKRLYKINNRFELDSEYSAFDKAQLASLIEVCKPPDDRPDGPLSPGAYLFFNPDLSGFSSMAQEELALLELVIPGSWVTAKFPWQAHRSDPKLSIQLQKEYLARRPGIRVTTLHALKSATDRGRPTLRNFLSHSREERWHRYYGRFDYNFMLFSEFMVDAIIHCTFGSVDTRLIRIAEGGGPGTPSVAYTLRLTLRQALMEDKDIHQ